MAHRDIILFGGSMGAIEALRVVLPGFDAGLPAAIFITLHTSPQSPGILDSIFSRVTTLSVAYATDGQSISHGRIYLAPVDHHLLVKRGRVRVSKGPRENRFRPAVDPLFRTAAVAHGPRVIAVVLSGGLDDGVVGLQMVKARGGVGIAQDPHDAVAPGMPQAAMLHALVEHVVPASEIAALVTAFVRQDIEVTEDDMQAEQRDVAETGTHNIHRGKGPGWLTPFTCPECGGALRESRAGELAQFQCHVGHRYSGDALAAAQSEALEHALWAGLRALEESAELRRRMAEHARRRGMGVVAASYEQQATESEERATMIRRVLIPGPGGVDASPPTHESDTPESDGR